MSAPLHDRHDRHACRAGSRRLLRSQAGVLAVEFGMLSLFFFAMVVGIIEVSRVLYIWNTVQEVTRTAARTASMTDVADTAALATVRQRAVFRTTPGELLFGSPISDSHVRIDYLALQRDASGALRQAPIPTGNLPACPMRNRLICDTNSSDARCVRLVRARICDPAQTECVPVRYQPLLSLPLLSIELPIATTIVRAESLGYAPMQRMCP